MKTTYDIVVIGGGPAGLAAACAAYDQGIQDVLILERDKELGGILNQCIHNGFGLHTFQEELTGPEYAKRYEAEAEKRKISCLLETMVLDISPEKEITALNRKDGLFTIQAKAVILAMGCRERPRGALNIPGYRPAGIYSAGTAQRLVNIEGYLPGREVVILGSGDIGLIMARRMTLEGAKVKVVAELMPYSGGLKRNIVQCLDDFGIPLKLSHTVVDIKGKERVESVTLAQVDENRKPIPGTEEEYTCDTLLLSVGLIPENELSDKLGVQLHPVTGGPVVNESLETSIPGVFACGNVLHVHDLVDFVSQEATMAGTCAAAYVKTGRTEETEEIPVKCGSGVRYTVPAKIRPAYMEEKLPVRFRVGQVYQKASITVRSGDTVLLRKKRPIMAPGEMETVYIKKDSLSPDNIGNDITISVEEEKTMEEKKLTCICCPMGCQLQVTIRDGQVEKVEGNTCKRGAEYGKKEVTNPTRIVTTTVRVHGGSLPVVPVKTASDIPKSAVMDCIRQLKEVVVEAPVYIGDVVLTEVAGTKIAVIITKNIEKLCEKQNL